MLTPAHGREVFVRVLGCRDFDASEISSAEFICMAGARNRHSVAIAVFVSCIFRHDFNFINLQAGIRTPKDLERKRVGAPLYTPSLPMGAQTPRLRMRHRT